MLARAVALTAWGCLRRTGEAGVRNWSPPSVRRSNAVTDVRSWGLWALPRRVRGTILVTNGAAAATLLWSVMTSPPFVGSDWLLVSLLLAAGGVSELANVPIGRTRSRAATDRIAITMSTDSVWVGAAMVAAPTQHVVLVAVLLAVLVGVRDKRSAPGGRSPAHRIVYNASMVCTSAACGSLVFRACADYVTLPTALGSQLIAASAGYLVMHLVETVMLASLMATHGAALSGALRELLWRGLPDDMALYYLGLLLAVAWQSDPALLLAGIPVVVLAQRGLQHWQLLTAAAQDQKTGVASATEWHVRAQQVLSATRAVHGQLGVAIIDLDRFKAVNDTHGHLVGDQILVATAAALRAAARHGDLVGRFGGDEFVVLIPAADRATVAAVGERLRAAAQLSVAVPGSGQPLTTSASVGVAAFPADGAALEDLLEQADRALYAVKHSHRGRMAFPPPRVDAA